MCATMAVTPNRFPERRGRNDLPQPRHYEHRMKRQFFFDTEFMERDGHVELLSIGIVKRYPGQREDYFYGINEYADESRANKFVRENVLPSLADEHFDCCPVGGHLWDLGKRIEGFLQVGTDGPPLEAWAYYADYDWVAFCSMWGEMVSLPKGMPWFCMDVKQYAEMIGVQRDDLPAGPVAEHHALVDARWNMDAYDSLVQKHDYREAFTNPTP